MRRTRTRTLAAAALCAMTLAGPAFAMPVDPPHKPARTHRTTLLPGRVDAAAQAATLRGIGARLLAG